MVPVDQEVPSVHLVDLDRREVPAGERTFDALPPVLDVGAAGQELESSAVSSYADEVLLGKSGEVLPEILNHLREQV